jgi:hypothetical protein
LLCHLPAIADLPAIANKAIMLSQNHFPEPKSAYRPILLCRQHTEHRWRCSQ